MIWLVFEHSSWAPKHYILFCGLLILILTKHLISINLLEKCKLRANTTSTNPNNSINIRRIASNNNIAPADADEIEATMQQQKLMKKMKSMQIVTVTVTILTHCIHLPLFASKQLTYGWAGWQSIRLRGYCVLTAEFHLIIVKITCGCCLKYECKYWYCE